MATVVIQKRKGKKGMSYAVRYADPITGKKKHFKTFKKQKEAQHAANDLRALLDSGKMPVKKRTKLSLLTSSDVAASLESEWVSRLRRNDLSQKTYEEYCIWLNVLNRIFGQRMLCQITAKEIETYVGERAYDYTPVTANKYLSMFRKVFEHGLKLGAVVSNPANEIPFLCEKQHERKRYILPHDLDRLIEVTEQIRAKFYLPAIIYLGAEHGAAKQEILSLRWLDIDFGFAGKGLIHFYRTKNKKERTEFLMPRARKALLEWRDHLEWKRHREKIVEVKSEHVFCRIDGTPINRFDKAWKHVLGIAGIKDFHFHDLRHTFGSNLLLAGASLKDVKEMMGHSDISTTDRYAHLTANHKLLMQGKLAEHYANGPNP
jgi:integrase